MDDVKIFRANNVEAIFPADLKNVDYKDRRRIQSGFSIMKFLIKKYPDLAPEIQKMKEDE